MHAFTPGKWGVGNGSFCLKQYLEQELFDKANG